MRTRGSWRRNGWRVGWKAPKPSSGRSQAELAVRNPPRPGSFLFRSDEDNRSCRMATPARMTLVLLLANLTVGCDRLGIGEQAVTDDGAPDEQQLRKISYMAVANSGPNGRKIYDHLEQARSCDDLELAMRWNRPPNVESGPFHKKLVYVSQQLPPD